MAVENTDTTDKGTNQGDPVPEGGENKTVDNKTDADTQQGTTDQQADAQKKDDGVKEPDTTQLTDGVKIEGEKEEVPEKYDDFKLPEGFTMDQGALEAFSPVAKELGMSQVNAQKLIDLYSSIQSKQAESIQKLFAEEHEKSIATVKADPEMGGNNYEANLKIACNVIVKYGSKDVLGAFAETGIGDNPDVIRMFLKIGKAMGEDSLVDKNDGGGAGVKPKSFGELLYNEMD